MRLLLLLMVVVSVVGCKSNALPGGGDGGGVDASVDAAVDQKKTARVPLVHRPAAVACSTDRAPVNCTSSVTGQDICDGDDDCTDSSKGTNGRCVGGGHGICACSYDVCTTDANCGATELCNCRAAGSGTANTCITAGCKIDADCGDNYCSPSLDPTCGTFFGITSWRCHTASDECVDDADCKDSPGGFGNPFCAYFPEVGHWRCSTSQCAG